MAAVKILVVEDEEQVRTLIVRLLVKRGYQVDHAVNGRQALEKLRADIGSYALVISDVIMPEMGGVALLQELRALRTDLPFLCMTGYTREEIVNSNEALLDAHFIEKPFTPTTLIDQVERILGAR